MLCCVKYPSNKFMLQKQNLIALVLQLTMLYFTSIMASWEEWWTYDGISGPAFWGLINPDWSLCNKGRRQSPINIDPTKLLYDPSLRFLHIDKHRVSGNITNTGHSVIFRVEQNPRQQVNLTGGPLSYKYQFEELHIHYGIGNSQGSEHTLNGYAFPAEIQLFGFNSDLYRNMSDASRNNQGLVAVALMIQLGDAPNSEFRIVTSALNKIQFKGQHAFIKQISIRGLLPDTDYFMTYEGSTTMPGCYESVTWVIMNKPIYVTKQQLYALRRLMQGEKQLPKAPLGDNIRPSMPLHHRTILTNIDFKQTADKKCPTMYKNMYYKGWSSTLNTALPRFPPDHQSSSSVGPCQFPDCLDLQGALSYLPRARLGAPCTPFPSPELVVVLGENLAMYPVKLLAVSIHCPQQGMNNKKYAQGPISVQSLKYKVRDENTLKRKYSNILIKIVK